MCKITRFELDEALEHIKSHAPHAHAVIEKYVDQLDNERAELYVSLLLLANSIPMDVLRMKAGNASLDMEIAENAMNDARSLLERSK